MRHISTAYFGCAGSYSEERIGRHARMDFVACAFVQTGNKPGDLPGVHDWRIGAVLEQSSGMPIEI
jgi:hypothetical protein